MIITDEIRHRFRGVRAVYGEDAFRNFASSHVFIAGVGGVGSWCAESLIRSGIGKITMLDCDTIEDSNSNRQLHTMQSTLGQLKAAVLEKRFSDINPQAEIRIVTSRLTVAGLAETIPENADIYIDAIDDLPAKASLIHFVHRRLKRKIIVSGGAGGKKNAGLLKTADLSATCNDALLSRLRSILRRRGLRRSGRVRKGGVSGRRRHSGIRCTHVRYRLRWSYDRQRGSEVPLGKPPSGSGPQRITEFLGTAQSYHYNGDIFLWIVKRPRNILKACFPGI